MFTQMVGKHGELDTAQADRGQIPILHNLVNLFFIVLASFEHPFYIRKLPITKV